MLQASPKEITQGDIISVASLGIMVGVFFTQTLFGFARGDLLAWVYVAVLAVAVGCLFVVARRTLRKIPTGS